jgi:signal recognition particle receptor subunit beta
VIVSLSEKTITLKVLYYGPEGAGKSTNLIYINENYRGKKKDFKEIETMGQKHLSITIAPIGFETLKSFSIWVDLVTVPGKPEYQSARRLLLRDTDAVIFVVDSQIEKTNENFQMIVDLKDNLKFYDLTPKDVFIIMQYNKRDLPDAAPIPYLQRVLNSSFNAPYTEAIAIQGVGVTETLNTVLKRLISKLKAKYGT